MKRTYKSRAAGSGDRFRSVLLSITFCSMLLVMVLLHWGCDSHQPRYGKCETLPRKIEEMSTSTLMPSSSRNIEYLFHDTGFGYGIEWKASVPENDFLSFCQQNGFSPLSEKPENENYFFQFYRSFDMPKSYYYVLQPRASSAALRLLYDRETKSLYGAYADR